MFLNALIDEIMEIEILFNLLKMKFTSTVEIMNNFDF